MTDGNELLNPIILVDALSTDIVNSLDGKPTDVAVMSCLESAIRVIKMTTGLTTVGAIDVLIDCLSKARVEGTMSVRNHITPGAKCCLCNKVPAIGLTRVVYRDDGMPQDAMLWGGACCWVCSLLVGAFIQQHIDRGDFKQ